MNLRQQIINDQVEKTRELLQVTPDKAFLVFTHSLISDTSIHAFSPSDDVDGGQDKQIDAITIEDNNDEAIVYITQAKNETGFSSNQIIKIRNGLNWIFNKSKTDIQTLSNQRFIDAIMRYRDLQNNIGPSNIQVKVSYISNGNSKEYSPECTQEIKTILDEYNNDTFSSFKFELIGYDELVDLINSQDKKNNKINANIKIRYDTNTPSLIKYHNRGLKGIICTAPAKEIADIVNQDSKGFVFDLNIRRFLGTQGAVNKDIIETCSDPEENHLFWFLNNGITIVCDKVDPITDPDDPRVKIDNMQIVNGCQTASSLAKASRDGTLMEDARVILRIYETNELDLVDKIVLTTNNQNKINGKNLRANDIRQVDIEKGFRLYGFYYERKQRQYVNDTIPNFKIAPNEIVAASYLSIVLKRPSDARSRKYKIWSEFYSKIFSGGIVEPYLISFLVYNYISEYLKSNFRSEIDEITRYITNNAAFHISRLSTYYWKQNDNWMDQNKLSTEVDLLISFPNTLNSIIPKAILSLKKLIESNPKYRSDLNTALKSSELDNDINRLLYTSS